MSHSGESGCLLHNNLLIIGLLFFLNKSPRDFANAPSEVALFPFFFSLPHDTLFFFVLTNQHLLKSEIASEMEDRGGTDTDGRRGGRQEEGDRRLVRGAS